MQLTKYAHSCVRLDEGEGSIVFDPGVYSEAEAALAGADAILITHEHPDHVDEVAIRKAMSKSSDLRIWAPWSVASIFDDFGDRVSTVNPNESFDVVGFHVTTHGGQHALIHPRIPLVANVGYLVNDGLYHPGDSLIVPTSPVTTLLLPLHAPWSKFQEVVDFMVSVRADRCFQIHDALLSDVGREILEKNVERVTADYGLDFRMLKPGQCVKV